jgi:preprotein translocase subunit SecF
MISLIRKRFRFLAASGLVLLAGIVSLLVFGLNSGIDFSSGSMLTLSFDQTVTQDELKAELDSLGHGNAIVQTTGEGDFLIRTTQLTNEEKGDLKESLTEALGPLEELGFTNVDPIIAHQTAQTAGIAIAIAAVGILLYITWAFRRMPRPFHYGTCGIIALLHDIVITVGIFSILGAVLGWEIDLMFIIGILAVIGYSINNTVVIFDRIRENISKDPRADFAELVNSSVSQSLIRSVNTSLTTIVVLLALLLFIGSQIQTFASVMLIGILAGTYSSLFVAPSLLVIWERREWRRLLPFGSRGR